MLIPDLEHPVKRKVILAGGSMLIFAMLSLLLTLSYVPVVFWLFYNTLTGSARIDPCPTSIGMLITMLSGFYYVFVLIRSVHMLMLTDREQAIVAAGMVMVPCNPCFVIGLPIGLWALKVLRDEEVKQLFKR